MVSPIDLGGEPGDEAHDQRAAADDHEGHAGRGVAELLEQPREQHPREEHRHAEDAGQHGRRTGPGTTDLVEVGDGPDADRELARARR